MGTNLQVLWPYLLEFIVPVQYMKAVGIVSRCIADIAKRKREAEADDYELNFDELSECSSNDVQHTTHVLYNDPLLQYFIFAVVLHSVYTRTCVIIMCTCTVFPQINITLKPCLS